MRMRKKLNPPAARDLRRTNPSSVGDRRIRRINKLQSPNFMAEIRVEEDRSEPKKTTTVLSFAGIELSESKRFGVVSEIGRRREMEDSARAEPEFAAVAGERRFDFYGVYDGHGGGHVSIACRDRLHAILAAEMAKKSPESGDCRGEFWWRRVMESSFGEMEEEIGGNAAARTVGATAVVAVVSEDHIVVANCGDCRAVLCRDGVSLPLSIDHKPNRPDELERIEAAGGRVLNWNGYRVLGVLATSRSIGDQYLRPFVISKPEVTLTKRTNKDEFLILASDGLWDVVSNEVACKVVKKCLGRQNNKKLGTEVIAGCENRASEAATLLAELAMAWGSRDNITVIVVDLRKP